MKHLTTLEKNFMECYLLLRAEIDKDLKTPIISEMALLKVGEALGCCYGSSGGQEPKRILTVVRSGAIRSDLSNVCTRSRAGRPKKRVNRGYQIFK
ncbi:unnamed protein product [Nezara viridula]|uniref:Uncharacterized protein n=1 Tax=Nezara viridula TaxID=85310 RepID=A0A9P0HHP3_NEZVI|nr:unnamed protein product [Nezara viridula]